MNTTLLLPHFKIAYRKLGDTKWIESNTLYAKEEADMVFKQLKCEYKILPYIPVKLAYKNIRLG